MLSYHGNDHYNSVRSIHACPSFLGGMIDDRRDGEGQRRSSKKASLLRSAERGGGNGDGAAADDANKDNACGADDVVERAKASQSTTEGRNDRRIVGNEGRMRPPARGSVCPCGSGKKYKKCCSARDKIKTRRLTRLLLDCSTLNEDGSARESDYEKEKEKEKVKEKVKDGSEGFIGSFKVLAI